MLERLRTARAHFLILAVAVAVVYVPTVTFPFTNWDDTTHVLENPVLQHGGPLQLLTPGTMPEERLFIPVTYLTFFIETRVFGFNAAVMHLTNVLLHACNALLVYLLAAAWLRCRPAALAAALCFALHPLQVEAVAWIMGRKEVLSACLALLCLYWRQRRASDLWATVFCVAAMLAKPTMLVLPLIAVAADVYQTGHWRPRALVWPALWLAAAVVIFGLNSALGASTLPPMTFNLWFLPGLVEHWVLRLLLLAPLCAYYGLTTMVTPQMINLPAALLALALTGAVYVAARLRRWPVVFGTAFTVIAALPLLRVVLIPDRGFLTADRYGYFPIIGLALIFGWAAAQLFDGRGQPLLWLAVGCLATAPALRRVPVWRSSETLWRDVLTADPAAYIAHHSLGNHYAANGETAAAALAYRRALSLRPGYARAWYNLGRLRWQAADAEQALACLRRAGLADHGLVEAHWLTAVIEQQRGHAEAAQAAYGAVLARRPDHAGAWYQLGVLLQASGSLAAARDAYRAAAQYAPDDAEAWFKVGLMQHRLGDLEAAAAAYRSALKLDPDHQAAGANLQSLSPP